MKKVLIAMSGGVDSSAAALLLQKEGYDCAGAMMRLYVPGMDLQKESGRVLSGADAVTDAERDAAAAAAALGIPFSIYDMRGDFFRWVIRDFIDVYKAGGTPNPCITCNRTMKFGAFLDMARRMGYDKIATGHYARVSCENGRYTLYKADDPAKDQSYVLWSLGQEQLSSLLLPLGSRNKEEARAAARAGALGTADKKESQDICFIPDGDYAGFIERTLGISFPEGDFVDEQGRVLGRHRGIIRYTVGQRRGLGISAGEPLYVLSKDAKKNQIVLGPEKGLFSGGLSAVRANWICGQAPASPLRVQARIRYNQKAFPATVVRAGEDAFCLAFDAPQRAVSPGQSVVLYAGARVLGGGIIAAAQPTG